MGEAPVPKWTFEMIIMDIPRPRSALEGQGTSSSILLQSNPSNLLTTTIRKLDEDMPDIQKIKTSLIQSWNTNLLVRHNDDADERQTIL